MKKSILVFILLSLALSSNAKLVLSNLCVENRTEPIGLDVRCPKFSWIIASDKNNTVQTAYEIKVVQKSNGRTVWSSGKVKSDCSIQVEYGGTPLLSNQYYTWCVRVWDNHGRTSGWSQSQKWSTGFFDAADWKAQWIENSQVAGDEARCPYFRKTFKAEKSVVNATLFITSHGLYEAFLNGSKVGDAFLTPGFTSYNKRLQYQVYDVTSSIKKGANAIGVVVGNGWYRGTLNWVPKKMIYGKELGVLCQIVIKYADGTEEIVKSDGSWKTGFGAIQMAEIYNGETIDANKSESGWALPFYNDSKWLTPRIAQYSSANLVGTYSQAVKEHETFVSGKFIITPKHERVIDFGQNLVGWEKIRIKGHKGDTIRIYHAEMLDKEGNFYTENLRKAKATSTYILSGNEDVFEPHFTYYGFRYIKIEGVDNSFSPANVTAIAVYSDMPKTGSLTTSNSLVNQLQHNIEWGQKGNFLDIPTDCPQRDERLGWTGDAHAFFRTAVYNRDAHCFFRKWLKDLAADQLPNGSVPYVIPNTLTNKDAGSTGWGDVATIIPWQMYMAYGDKDVLKQQYGSMKAWVEYMRKASRNYLWNTQKTHFGDWLFYRPDDDKDGIAAITDKQMIAQCFFAHSTQFLINAATVLGYKEDVSYYEDLLKHIKQAYQDEYMTKSGCLVSNTQTAYVLALYFDMLPESLREQAVQRLVDNIAKYKNHITTGFLGTPYICHVLSRFGRSDVAYKLLLQDTYPSWLYPVKAGATTIWERWDGRKPDGTFQTSEMNSFNHYAYGAIGDWLYREAAGISEAAAGYKQITIRPHIGGNFTWMKAEQKTPYGICSSEWKVTGDRIQLDVVIPANTTASVDIPSKDGYITKNVGSGKYTFVQTIK
jgi:alpha-L-rhamnosidase